MNLALPRLRRAMMLAPIALAAALVACGGSDDNDTPAQQPLALTIAHINDHHSNLDAFAAQTMKIGGVDTQVEHVTDPTRIAAYGVMSTPALVVRGRVVAYGRVLTKEEALKILKESLENPL